MDAEKSKGEQAPENILGGSVPQPLQKGWIPNEKVITVGESSSNILSSIVDAEKSKEGQTPENLLGESVPQDSIIPDGWLGGEEVRKPHPEEENDPDFEEKIQRESELLMKTLKQTNNDEYEILDWEKEIKKYREEIEKEEREKEERLSNVSRKEKTWKLMRLCKEFIEKNSKSWKTSKENREAKKKEEMEKTERLGKAERKKKEHREKMMQRKITEKWMSLPEPKRDRFRKEEEKRKRIELQEIKQNLHKWRNKLENEKKVYLQRKTNAEEMENKLKRLDILIEKAREEDKKRIEIREENKKEKERIFKIRRDKNEEKIRVEEERKERLRVQKKLKEKWEMIKWLSEYAEANQEIWEMERREREEDKTRKIKEWEKLGRLEKIRMIRERQKMKETIENRAETTGEVIENWKWSSWRKGEQVERKEDQKFRNIENEEIIPPKKDAFKKYEIQLEITEKILNVEKNTNEKIQILGLRKTTRKIRKKSCIPEVGGKVKNKGAEIEEYREKKNSEKEKCDQLKLEKVQKTKYQKTQKKLTTIIPPPKKQQDIRSWAKKLENNENAKNFKLWKSFDIPKTNKKRKIEEEEIFEKKVKFRKTSTFQYPTYPPIIIRQDMEIRIGRDEMKEEKINSDKGGRTNNYRPIE